MSALAGLPPQAFRRHDETPDADFYAQPRLVAHIDDRAIAAVTGLYREVLPPGGRILDLMSSWISHLPEDVAYAEVAGHGLNGAELDANPRLTSRLVQDLNRDPALPYPPAHFDGAGCCVSVQYLTDPVAVFAEVRRVLRPGAPFVATFSNRCFPTKAVFVWQALREPDKARLLEIAMAEAGFASAETRVPIPPGAGSDPLFAVIGRA